MNISVCRNKSDCTLCGTVGPTGVGEWATITCANGTFGSLTKLNGAEKAGITICEINVTRSGKFE